MTNEVTGWKCFAPVTAPSPFIQLLLCWKQTNLCISLLQFLQSTISATTCRIACGHLIYYELCIYVIWIYQYACMTTVDNSCVRSVLKASLQRKPCFSHEWTLHFQWNRIRWVFVDVHHIQNKACKKSGMSESQALIVVSSHRWERTKCNGGAWFPGSVGGPDGLLLTKPKITCSGNLHGWTLKIPASPELVIFNCFVTTGSCVVGTPQGTSIVKRFHLSENA